MALFILRYAMVLRFLESGMTVVGFSNFCCALKNGTLQQIPNKLLTYNGYFA